MKIDPITGKAYLTEWQRDLDRLHHAGYSDGYVEIVNLASGELSWQVDAMKNSHGCGQSIPLTVYIS